QQLRGGIDGMAELIAPLPHLRVLGQEAIHRAFGTDVLPGVEQRGIDLRRGVIHEARLMQQREDRAALARTERAGRGAPRRPGPRAPSGGARTTTPLAATTPRPRPASYTRRPPGRSSVCTPP